MSTAESQATMIDAGSCRRATATLALAAAVGLMPSGAVGQEEPQDSGLVEKTGARLVQVDVSVTGPPDVIATLGPEDFRVKVNGIPREEFTIDRLCEASGQQRQTATSVPSTFLFYFDQTHLTLAGRVRAFEIARELVPRLLDGRNRAMVVSNSTKMLVAQELTTDADAVLAALTSIEHDPSQWAVYAQTEDQRVDDVVGMFDKQLAASVAMAIARNYQREESWRTDRDLRRLKVTLGRLSEEPQPKAVLYFADHMRSNAGAHYMSFFTATVQQTKMLVRNMNTDAAGVGAAFETVLNTAATYGIRFYSVLAQGLVTPFDASRPSSGEPSGSANQTSSPSFVRHRDSQETLGSMARETGGRSFLRGETGERIARTLVADLSCIYLFSLDPSEYMIDSPLRIKIQTRRKGVRLRSRGRLYSQSPEARKASRMQLAFLQETSQDGVGVQARLIPTGFDDGAYSALLQLSVPASRIPRATWDIGATVVYRDRIADEVSARMSVQTPGRMLVLEREIEFGPGAHELTAVAHETTTDTLLSQKLEIEWPDPDQASLTVSPVALLQPQDGVFSREGEKTRPRGPLAKATLEPLRTDLPAAITGLVCRGRRNRDAFDVVRVLTGRSEKTHEPLQIESSCRSATPPATGAT